jgi:hypothetical protein
MTIDKIADDQFINKEWFYSENPDYPSEIEIPLN